MWENVVDPERQHMRVWRMRIARCIPKATNTHSEYVILNVVYLKHGHTNAPPCYVLPKLPVFFSPASSPAAWVILTQSKCVYQIFGSYNENMPDCRLLIFSVFSLPSRCCGTVAPNTLNPDVSSNSNFMADTAAFLSIRAALNKAANFKVGV